MNKLLLLLQNAHFDGFEWVAQDGDGWWYAYELEPSLNVSIWSSPQKAVRRLMCTELETAPEFTLSKITDKIKEYEQL